MKLSDRLLGFWREYAQSKTGVLGLAMMVAMIVLALIAPYVAIYDPFELHNELTAPPGTGGHILGTDYLGRDTYSQIVWGTRASLLLGVAVGGLSLLIGIVLGLIPGWYGGKTDHLFSRGFELFLVLPTLLLAVVLVTIFRPSIITVIFCLAITLWPSNAKLTRAQVLAWKNRSFIDAAVSMGASTPRILFYHILPNGLSPLLANSFLQMARAILAEAALAFLGLSDPNVVSWGRILLYGQRVPTAWWMLLFPGIMLTLLVLSLNFIGDALNFVLNPRMRER